MASAKEIAEIVEIDEIDVTGVAQYLAELSQEGRLPQGVEQQGNLAPFLSDEVSFNDNDWLRRTLSVQSWLCLDSPISLEIPAFDAATSLLEQISPDPAEDCLTLVDDSVQLTSLGSQHLETWLSRAIANREAFLEALEEDRPLRDASEEWA